MFGFPNERCGFACDSYEWASNVSEMWDKAMIEIGN